MIDPPLQENNASTELEKSEDKELFSSKVERGSELSGKIISERITTAFNSNNPGEIVNNSLLFHLKVGGRHYVRCTPCFQEKLTVERFRPLNTFPAIMKESGTAYRKEVVENFEMQYHKEAIKAYRISALPRVAKIHSGSIGKSIAQSMHECATKIGQLKIHAYCDGKKLTLSGYSFPARIVTSQVSSKFSYGIPQKIICLHLISSMLVQLAITIF